MSLEAAPREKVLIFGQGPVIDPETGLKASDVNTPLGRETVNYWSTNLAEAATVLIKLDPSIREFTIMGGPTGGEQYASEAKLISNVMKNNGVPEQVIKLEEQSSDTIENIVNFLNLYDNQNDSSSAQQAYSILSASYHSIRVQILMKLFCVQIKHRFSSEEVLRYVARTTPDQNQPSHLVPTDDSSKWNHSLLQKIEDQLDINDPTKYTSRKKGTEKRDVADRFIKDDLLIRELLQFPEKWLPYVGKLKNDRRVANILQQTEEIFPGKLRQYGLQSEDNLETKKTKLKQIIHTPLSEETMQQWANENRVGKWPSEVWARRNLLIGSN